jgi:hypothetical protein
MVFHSPGKDCLAEDLSRISGSREAAVARRDEATNEGRRKH